MPMRDGIVSEFAPAQRIGLHEAPTTARRVGLYVGARSVRPSDLRRRTAPEMRARGRAGDGESRDESVNGKYLYLQLVRIRFRVFSFPLIILRAMYAAQTTKPKTTNKQK